MVAPAPEGVNVAVYVIPEPEKLEMIPPVLIMSDSSKFVVSSLNVKTNPIDESPVELPSVTPEVELVIVTVGEAEGIADNNWIRSMYTLPALAGAPLLLEFLNLRNSCPMLELFLHFAR